MTREQAQAILNQIAELKSSIKAQINREFEGVDMGIELPQEREISRLTKEMVAGGWCKKQSGELYSKEEWQADRQAWNAAVNAAPRTAKGVKLEDIEKSTGLRMVDIKIGKANFGE